MDDEIEDVIGDVKYTDSQKSVATSNVYSMDFTDCSSERNNSSGKETYVIDLDTSEDSEKNYPVQKVISCVTLKEKDMKRSLIPVTSNRDVNTQYEITKKVSRAASTSSNKYLITQEIYTQTSKTIIELAAADYTQNNDLNTLETQTSLISIKENKTVEYRIEINEQNESNVKDEVRNVICDKVINDFTLTLNQAFNNSVEDGSSKFPFSESNGDNLSSGSSEKLINIFNVDSKEICLSEEQNEIQYQDTSDFETTCSDVDEDSLIDQGRQKLKSESFSDVSEMPKSVDNEIEELYTKLSESVDVYSLERSCDIERRKLSPLTTLTEESAVKDFSLDTMNCTKNSINISDDKDVLFTNNEGMKIKLLPMDALVTQKSYKLPPIRNQSCPNSPHLDFLFSVAPTPRPFTKLGTSSSIEGHKEMCIDRWEIRSKDLAAGESANICGRSDSYPDTNYSVHLPPIHCEGHVTNQKINKEPYKLNRIDRNIIAHNPDSISITSKIRELKMTGKLRNRPSSESRSISPSSTSPDRARICDLAERGCESLCAELLRRLRSSSWYEILNTLEDVSKQLERFWGVITEQRIADLIRQIIVHVESPRTQVARSACYTLAAVLKNTNYTKKPDFYEAVTILLTKTGSFSRPVRRAANVALDDVVCGVDLTHAVTALCVYGVGHKSALVRCASARLLVVCCALASGGRELLRARPPTAAGARRQALRSLATLLEDKNTDTRKYAERLYTMLRPLNNFEAYYLTDVDVELASRQMKKYDQMLLSGTAKEVR